jgi:nickel transport protein
MRNLLALALMLAITDPRATLAHEITRTVTRENAVVITLSDSNGSPFGHEEYEIKVKGEDRPFQTGRTDARGRIVFIPDRRASWQIRAFSEDGHGVDMNVDLGPEGTPGGGAPSGSDRASKIVFGVVMILLVFTIFLVVNRRRAI